MFYLLLLCLLFVVVKQLLYIYDAVPLLLFLYVLLRDTYATLYNGGSEFVLALLRLYLVSEILAGLPVQLYYRLCVPVVYILYFTTIILKIRVLRLPYVVEYVVKIVLYELFTKFFSILLVVRCLCVFRNVVNISSFTLSFAFCLVAL